MSPALEQNGRRSRTAANIPSSPTPSFIATIIHISSWTSIIVPQLNTSLSHISTKPTISQEGLSVQTKKEVSIPMITSSNTLPEH
jgi:hypothetical protein